jgi:FixJ family two-component response regulator
MRRKRRGAGIELDQGLFSGYDMLQKTMTKGEILVLDDEAATRETLSIALQQEGYDVICFADGASLLSSARARIPVCIFLEVSIPGQSGLDTLKRLRAEDFYVPIFVTSRQADIPTVVDAIKNGALDFIEKPFLGSEIIPRVMEAVDELPRHHVLDKNLNMSSFQFPGCEPLTRREQQVLAQIAAGASNKEAGRQLGLSSRTIEDHRAKIMKKVGVKNAAELVRRVFTAGHHS